TASPAVESIRASPKARELEAKPGRLGLAVHRARRVRRRWTTGHRRRASPSATGVETAVACTPTRTRTALAWPKEIATIAIRECWQGPTVGPSRSTRRRRIVRRGRTATVTPTG